MIEGETEPKACQRQSEQPLIPVRGDRNFLINSNTKRLLSVIRTALEEWRRRHDCGAR
jgi:hypothetical protein